MSIMENITAFIAAAFGGGLLVFVQFLITRHDNNKGYIAELRNAITSIKDAFEEERMIVRRRNIFRFSQEVRKGERHTKEEWDQVNQDISDYKSYCNQHPDFVNNRCQLAIEGLEAVYKKAWETDDFAIERRV